MRKPLKEPSKSRLIIAAMWTPQMQFAQVQTEIERVWGKVFSQSEIFPFGHSAYYENEMGKNISKTFFEIETLVFRNELVSHKKLAWVLEEQWMTNGSRILNLDPMILSLENIVISTSKGFSHRVYLSDGIYGDLAFIRKANKYEPLPWTYPDYITNLPFFERVRANLGVALDTEKH